MTDKTFIYLLRDPRTFEVRYVGKASKPYSRFRAHLTEKGTYRKIRWVQYLLANGLRPIMEVVLCCNINQWEDVERRLIASYRKQFNLVNNTAGGIARGFTKEDRKKTADNLRGRKRPDISIRVKEYYKTHRCIWKGKNLPESTRKKIGEKSKLKVYSEEYREKLRKASTGPKGNHAIPVLQFALDGTFICKWSYRKGASDYFNIKRCCISDCCTGTQKTAGGYIWRNVPKYHYPEVP